MPEQLLFRCSVQVRWKPVELDLKDVWPANRRRWWCLLTPLGRPPVQVRAWTQHGPWRTVSDVLQIPQSGGQVDALLLTAYELEEFQARRPLESFVMRANCAMPTALHSWGSQVYPCPCGCRPFPFKPAWLDDKLCVVLLREYRPEGMLYRHLTPREAALLNGLSPEVDLGDDQRLALALVGQLASPLQSCWVLAQMRLKHGAAGVVDQPVVLLDRQRSELLAAATRCGMRLQLDPGSGAGTGLDGVDAAGAPAASVRGATPETVVSDTDEEVTKLRLPGARAVDPTHGRPVSLVADVAAVPDWRPVMMDLRCLLGPLKALLVNGCLLSAFQLCVTRVIAMVRLLWNCWTGPRPSLLHMWHGRFSQALRRPVASSLSPSMQSLRSPGQLAQVIASKEVIRQMQVGPPIAREQEQSVQRTYGSAALLLQGKWTDRRW